MRFDDGRSAAALVLEDGTAFIGRACGAAGEVFGEICFNTSMVGYQEVISDPSYAGQIITMTYPQIGNYGVNRADLQCDTLHLRGLVVRDMCYTPSNFRSEMSLPDFLAQENIVAIEGIDTRKLTRHIRERGAMRAVLSTEDIVVDSLLEKVRQSESIVGVNLAAAVSTKVPYLFDPEDYPEQNVFEEGRRPSLHHVVAYDCGVKRSILRGLTDVGCKVTVVPWDTSAAEVLAMRPDGVFFSNGPGDPAAVTATIDAARELAGKFPIFGICLGHQIMNLACSGEVIKLKYGHRGGNQPVMNLLTGCVEITAQNHGFNIDPAAIGPLEEVYAGCNTEDLRVWVKRKEAPVRVNPDYGRVQLTHVNLNDGTAEGLAYLDVGMFSVQYHPEASPGPKDASYLFDAFVRLMEGREDYLDIDMKENRLAAL